MFCCQLQDDEDDDDTPRRRNARRGRAAAPSKPNKRGGNAKSNILSGKKNAFFKNVFHHNEINHFISKINQPFLPYFRHRIE